MTSVAGDNKVDAHLQESYLNGRCAYLADQLAQHNAQVSTRTRSVSVSDDQRLTQKHGTRQRHASAQVIILLNVSCSSKISVLPLLRLNNFFVSIFQ